MAIVTDNGRQQRLMLYHVDGFYIGWRKAANCTWLPQVFDYLRPERGLWGMVDWGRLKISPNDDGTVDIFENWEDYDDRRFRSLNTDLPIALAKAIIYEAEQEGK